MRLLYGLIADYAIELENKAVIVGVGDGWNVPSEQSPKAPVHVPSHCLVFQFGFQTGEVGEHRFHLALVTEDGDEIRRMPPVTLPIQQRRPGYEITQRGIIRLENLVVPGVGSYEWHVFLDDVRVGEIPFHVVQQEPAVPDRVITG